jgi:hypothetical protein
MLHTIQRHIKLTAILIFFFSVQGCSGNAIKDAQSLEIRPGTTFTFLLNSVVACGKMEWATYNDGEGKDTIKMDCVLNPKQGMQADLMANARQQIAASSDLEPSKRVAANTRWEKMFGENGKVVITNIYRIVNKKPMLVDVKVEVDGNSSSIGQSAALELFAVMGLNQPIDLKQQRLRWAAVLITKAQLDVMAQPILISIPYNF